VVAKVRKLSGIKKVGHAGTLDPLAEGVLVVLTEQDTKKQDSFKDLPKEYTFDFITGITTPSADLESTPLFVSIPDAKKIDELAPFIAQKFLGEIIQTAPVFSAKKVNGKRLYEVARSASYQASSTDIILPKSKVTIYDLQYLGLGFRQIDTSDGQKTLPVLSWKVHCSSGTYVRTLAEDIAKGLGTSAVVSKLIRTAIGEYKIEDSISIEALKFN